MVAIHIQPEVAKIEPLFGLVVLVGKTASLTTYVVIRENSGITQAAKICLLKFLNSFKTLKKLYT